jgi:hypothetical protein
MEEEPKYATLEAFTNSPDRSDAVFFIDNDFIQVENDAGEELLNLHPSEFVQQAIELLGFSYESV